MTLHEINKRDVAKKIASQCISHGDGNGLLDIANPSASYFITLEVLRIGYSIPAKKKDRLTELTNLIEGIIRAAFNELDAMERK